MIDGWELLGVLDAVGAQQVGQHRGCGIGIAEGIVWARDLHPVASAHVGQAVRQPTLGIERPRQPQGADRAGEVEGDTCLGGCLGEKRNVEFGVVGHEARLADALSQLAEYLLDRWRTDHVASADAMQTGGPDAVPPTPTRGDEAAPPVDHPTFAVDNDDSHLQQTMAAHRQAGGLDIDHGEALGADRGGHTSHTRRGVCHRSQGRSLQSSSAARLATALRSQAVRVTWPKHDCPANACTNTASALFDSPR